jgi:predicted transcriptional regulator
MADTYQLTRKGLAVIDKLVQQGLVRYCVVNGKPGVELTELGKKTAIKRGKFVVDLNSKATQ